MPDEKSSHVVNIVHETGLVETIKGSGYFVLVSTETGYFIGHCGLDASPLFTEFSKAFQSSLKHCPPDDIPETIRKLLDVFQVLN